MKKLKSINLFIALLEGFMLVRDAYNAQPKQYEKGRNLLYFYLEGKDADDKPHFETRGWGSYFDGEEKCLKEILQNPEWWEVTEFRFDKGDKPWSTQ
jgi:hypothetical protein